MYTAKMASLEEVNTAISSLEQSTSAIEGQISILLANRECLKSFQIRKAEADAKEKERLRSSRLEGQNLTLAVEESTAALSSDFRRVEKHLADQINCLEPTLIELLRQDDRILQRAAASSQVDVDDGQKLRERVTKLTQSLSQLAQEEIRCGLDRIYLECLASSSQPKSSASNVTGEQQLRQDLRSLHVEIADVATMAVTQEFYDPLSALIDAEFSRRNMQTQDSLSQVSGILVITLSVSGC